MHSSQLSHLFALVPKFASFREILRDCREGTAIADLLSQLYQPVSESAIIIANRTLIGQ
jgi:hypothetical protein